MVKGTGEDRDRCALGAVDQRLEDLHQQWHQAEAAYFNPERFRLAVQTAIQTLRTVTFILQKHKHAIPGFDAWYQVWVQRLKSDPLMRWMVNARNRIEKEGDLEANSVVRAEIVASYLDEGPRIEIPTRLFDSPWKLIRSIPKNAVGEHIRKHGTLRIERRWVENTLPEHELLDAVALAYGRISELVDDAHRQIGRQKHTLNTHTGDLMMHENSRGGRLPCMIGHAERRAIHLNLPDGRPLELEHKTVNVRKSGGKRVWKRYGIPPKKMFGDNLDSEEGLLSGLFQTARTVFLKDGYHESIFFLFQNCRLVHLFAIRPEDQRQKYMMMRGLADEVTKYGADAVVSVGEAWMAPPDPLRPYQRPGESPGRREMLMAILVTKGGTPVQMLAEIHRDGTTVRLGETETERDTISFAFAPVYQAWGRPIPEGWLKRVDEMFPASSS